MKFNKVLSYVTLIFFFFTILGNVIPVEAYADTLNPFNVSTTINGSSVDNLGTLNIANGSTLSLKFDIQPSYNVPVKAGDKITIQLPKVFSNLSLDTSNISKFFDIERKGNELTLIAKQAATTMLNAFLTIGAQLKNDKEDTTINEPLNVDGTTHTIKINVEKPYIPTPPKSDSSDNKGETGNVPLQHIIKTVEGNKSMIIPDLNGSNNTLSYEVEINTTDMNGNITFTDKMPEGLQLNPDSIMIFSFDHGMHNLTSELGKTIKFSDDNNKIIMSGFKPNTIYYLDYSAEIPLQFANSKENYKISNTAYLNNYNSTADVTINTLPPKITPEQKENMIHKWSNQETFSNIGDNIEYTLEINPSYNRLQNAKLIDKLPEGLELDPDMNKVFNYSVSDVNGGAAFKLNIYEINKDGSVKTIQSFQDPDGTLYYNLKTNTIEADLGNTAYKFMFWYNTKVTKLQASITNNATFSYNSMKSSSSATSTYTSSSGAIQAWKTVNKATLIEGENPDVQYQIHVKAYGFYPKNYITIKDSLAKGIKLESVEVPQGFTYKVEGNTVIATNSGTSFIAGQSAVVKLNCSLADFKGGTTIYNQAQVNGYNTNKVNTKKGYAFTAVKENAENNNQKLEGAVYGVYSATNNKLLYDVTSNANGELTGQIKEPGDYYLKEIKAPKGYELSKDKIQFKITSEDIGTTVNLGNIYDNELTSKITVKKLSIETNKTLKGAEFTITNSNGQVIKTITTGENGIATADLYPGTYTIKEVKAPIGYVNSNYTKTFTVAFGGEDNQEFTVKDSEVLGKLLITKIGSNGVKLKGAEFKVTGPNGFSKIVTTDTNGVANLENLQWGTYNIQEVKAPIGYKLSNKIQSVIINSQNCENTQNIIFNDTQILGKLNITKTGKDGVKLAGAEFTVSGPNGFKEVVTTDKDGVANLDNLQWGTYKVQETKAPEGYNLNNVVQTVQVTSSSVGQVQSLTFNDSQVLGRLNINKIGENGIKLAGAEFTVSGPNGFKEVVTTNKDGVASLDNLQWGTYKVQETKAPIGYKLSNEVESIKINSEDASQLQSLVFNDSQILGQLSIFKTGVNGSRLSGAEFKVIGPNGFNKIVTTDKNGVASLENLQWGTYKVQETKAPEGYNLNNEVQTVQVTNASVGQIQSLTFNDTQVLGKLNITKIGKDGVKLEGAEFDVTGPNGFNKIVTTNKDGVASLDNLQWGTYTIKETKAPQGYKLNENTQSIVINSTDVSNIQNITVVDGQETGNLTITKEGLNKEKLAGAVFEITGPNGFDREVTTGDNGSISLSGLPWGTYTIKEVKAPQGYELNNKQQKVEVNASNVKLNQNLIFTDAKLNGSIKVTKLGKGGAKLAGAEFTITGENNFKKVITTDINGVATLNNLPWGTYTIKETKAPLGYKLSDKTQSVTINSEDVSQVQSLTFNDTQILGELNIIKTGKDGVKLEGAEFTVSGPNGFKEVVTTNKNGVASLENLQWGTYKVQETKAPEGYNLNNEIQTVQVTSSSVGQVQDLTFNDTQILGKLNITKIGKDGVKLKGAEFTVSGPNGFKEVVTTNKNGVASLENLQWATYKVQETKAPLGYNLNNEIKTVQVTNASVSQVQDLTFNDTQILGKLNITKTGKDGVKLEGSEFTVSGPNGFKEVVTTNKNGVATLGNLQWGTYKVQETKAPEGYNLNNEIQTVQVTSSSVGQVQDLTFNDTQILGKLDITKIGKDGIKLEGAEFDVTGPNGFNKIVTTNKDGVASLDNLQWGTYKVQETKAPQGYKLNENTQSVVINSNDVSNIQNITVVDGQETGNLTITKEGPNKEKLAGAVFEITGPNGFEREVTTGDNGSVSLSGLPWGTYTVKEVKAPQGYELNNKPQKVEVNASNVKLNQNLIFTDVKLNGSIKVTKLGKDGVKLSGAEFTITGANNFKKVITTDINGVATLNNLPWGTYTIKETKAPSGYKLSDKTQSVTINSEDVSQLQSLTFNDTQILGKLNITKTGKDGVKLEGAEFTVSGPNGFKEGVTTNKNGVASLDNLQWGTYKVQETKAPEGYNLNNEVQTVQVTNASVGQVQSLTFNDTQVLGKLDIIKTGKDGVKLEGAEFDVTGPNGFNKIVTTNKDGVASLDRLQWGTYTVKEVKAPQGYLLDSSSKIININSTDVEKIQSLSFEDIRMTGNLEVTKLGKDGVKLAGAEFQVTGENNFNKVIITNKNGIASLNNLPWGTYEVKEIKAPLGYKLSDKTQSVTINSADVSQVQSLIFKDDQILGQLNITKTGKDGVKLEGAQFTISGPNGFKEVVTTNKNGVASLNNLQWGTYTIKEIKAPLGYNLNPKDYTVKIDSNNANVSQNIVIADRQITGSIKITKEGANKEKLAGATFDITGPNGFNRAITTGKNGNVSISGLAWGTYTIKEIIAPQGYLVSKEEQKVVIDSSDVSKLQDVIFIDNKILGQINITKTNMDGTKKLAGATFDVTGPNGFNKVVTTDKEGAVSLTGLAWGTYEVKEIKAPNGYNLNDKVQTVTINSENAKMINYLTFKDSLIDTNKIVNHNVTNNKLNNKKNNKQTKDNVKNKEVNKDISNNINNTNTNINNSSESPKTGDESELPIVLVLLGAVIGLVVINRKQTKDKAKL